MAKKGFTDKLPLTVPDVSDIVLYPDVARMKKSRQYLPGGPRLSTSNPGDTVPPGQPDRGSKSKDAAFLAATLKCNAAVAKVTKSIWHPLSSLGIPWQRIVTKVQLSPQVLAARAGYTACAVKQGVPAAEAKDFVGYTRYAGRMMTHASTDAQLIATDRRLAMIFVQRATPTVQLQEKMQLAAQKQFIQEHYQQITAGESQMSAAMTKLNAQLGIAATDR